MKSGLQEKLGEKWGITYEEMGACDIKLDETTDPETPTIRGTDENGHEIAIAKSYATVDGSLLSDKETGGLYNKYLHILSAKQDRQRNMDSPGLIDREKDQHKL